MKIDELGCLVSETCDYPGNIGDSCAETSRYAVLTPSTAVKLDQFRSATGYLRHPNAPDGPPVSLNSWRESDFSGDQATPLLMAYDLQNESLASEMRTRLKSTFKTGNGNLIQPGLFCLIFKLDMLLAFTLLVQAAIFLFPYRWSDSTKSFEKSEGSSADYLNWLVCLSYLHRKGSASLVRIVRGTVSASVLTTEITSYYKNEPNSDWLIQAYSSAISDIYN